MKYVFNTQQQQQQQEYIQQETHILKILMGKFIIYLLFYS